jgi:hypothetical protein
MSLTPELLQQIAEAIRRPEGTVTFEYSSSDAFGVDGPGGVIIEIPAGGHYFRLERTTERVLNFYHSSPATGTRIASINLDGVPSFQRAFLAFVWSPEETRFHCAPRDLDVQMLEATGVPSQVSFRVGSDGSVFQLGGEGAQVMGVRVQQGKNVVLAPTAIGVWQSTTQAFEVLWTGKSEEGFIFEVLQATLSLSMLVTGLENYAKTRLLEIETEGIEADASSFFRAFASKAERESERFAELQMLAAATGKSVFSVAVNSARINFQNFDDLKKAFRTAYGIKVGDLGVGTDVLAELRRLISYRHRVVHVSPLLAFLNQDKVPPEKPIFANRILSERAVAVFNVVVQALHKASTDLRPAS